MVRKWVISNLQTGIRAVLMVAEEVVDSGTTNFRKLPARIVGLTSVGK
jgi:hypothetical protein